MRKTRFSTIVLLFLFLPLTLAIEEQTVISTEEHTIVFTLIEGKTVVDTHIVFEAKQLYTLTLPADAQAISLTLEGKDITPVIASNKINIYARDVTLSYVSKEFLQQNTFLTDIPATEPIKHLDVMLVSDENQALATPLDTETRTSNSVFPKPTSVTTDGQRLVLTWQRTNLAPGESLSILVRFKQRSQPPIWIGISVGIIALLSVIIFILYHKKPRTITRVERVEVPVIREVEKIVEKPADHVERHLKEDEEQIVTLLKQREGSCEQGTLRVLTGFSKAKLSGILKELEARNVIKKETHGKKNLVFLRP